MKRTGNDFWNAKNCIISCNVIFNFLWILRLSLGTSVNICSYMGRGTKKMLIFCNGRSTNLSLLINSLNPSRNLNGFLCAHTGWCLSLLGYWLSRALKPTISWMKHKLLTLYKCTFTLCYTNIETLNQKCDPYLRKAFPLYLNKCLIYICDM